MNMKFKDIINIIDERCKLKGQEKWDNSGLQIGNLDSDITGVLLALDVTEEALDVAKNKGFNLIITHHPFFFGNLNKIDITTYKGRIIRKALLENINIYSMHTSLDMAETGVNSALAKEIGLNTFEVLNIQSSEPIFGYGGIADISEVMIDKYAEYVKECLDCKQVKLYTNNRSKVITRVAFCGGSGSDFIDDAISKKADVYITGDIKYHDAQYALQNGLDIIDAGHFYTENIVLKSLNDVLTSNNLSTYMFTQNLVKELYI